MDAGIQTALRHDAASAYVTDRSGALRCDAFVRLERVQTDLAPVERHLGFSLDLPHVNVSDHPPSRDLYTPETRALVADIFAEDIARFAYSFPG